MPPRWWVWLQVLCKAGLPSFPAAALPVYNVLPNVRCRNLLQSGMDGDDAGADLSRLKRYRKASEGKEWV